MDTIESTQKQNTLVGKDAIRALSEMARYIH